MIALSVSVRKALREELVKCILMLILIIKVE